MKSNHQKRASNRWRHNRIGKYSPEEIALEFILWEDEAAHSDILKRDFIYEALEQSVGDEDRDETLAQLIQAYERLYEKIYQRRRGNVVKEDRATPESVCRREERSVFADVLPDGGLNVAASKRVSRFLVVDSHLCCLLCLK